MAGWDKRLLWTVMFLFGASAQRVVYPPHVCGVKGSTLTLPCSFSPNGTVVRVRWCQNHQICQGKTPSVYDSDPTPENSSPYNNNPRYTYLGDKSGRCTLQIRALQKHDQATLRFRMETQHAAAHFTGPSGVNVSVVDAVRMSVRSSRRDDDITEGDAVTLNCTSVCSVHQLQVTWSKDDITLPESGPALSLTPLTAKHSGNYTCALTTNEKTRSLTFELKVKTKKVEQVQLPLVVGVVFSALVVLLLVFVLLWLFHRRRSSEEEQSTMGGDAKDPDHLYSSIALTSDPEGGGPPQKTCPPVEEVSYASIQFPPQHRDRAVQQVEDAVVYSAVVNSAVVNRG